MKKISLIVVLMMVLVVAFAACAPAAPAEEPAEAVQAEEASAEEQAEEAAELDGAVIVDGSGTVYPLMAHIAEEYMVNVQPNVSVQVGRAGSSAA